MKYIYLFLFTLLVVSCNRHDDDLSPAPQYSSELIQKIKTVQVPNLPTLSRHQIDDIIFNEIRTTNDFRWTAKDIHFLWSASQFTQGVAVGYKPANVPDITPLVGKIDMTSGAWREVHDKLITQILGLEIMLQE